MPLLPNYPLGSRHSRGRAHRCDGPSRPREDFCKWILRLEGALLDAWPRVITADHLGFGGTLAAARSMNFWEAVCACVVCLLCMSMVSYSPRRASKAFASIAARTTGTAGPAIDHIVFTRAPRPAVVSRVGECAQVLVHYCRWRAV